MTESRYLEELAEEEKVDASASSVSKYEALRSTAFELARKVGWERDIREGPFIAGIPTDTPGDDGYIMIAWKEDSNGTTFVVSPFNSSSFRYPSLTFAAAEPKLEPTR